jgi:acylglycerol lipase
MNETTFDGVGGLRIFTRSWPAPAGTPRGAVIIVHGFNSHSGYYNWAAEQLRGAGLAVHALDLRGRGKSDGERFYVDNFADYVIDLSIFVKQVKARDPGLPVFLLGHSAGGVICCTYLLEHQNEIAGFICESFAHEIPSSDFALAALKGLSHLAPHAHVIRLKNEDFSRDPVVVEAMNNDLLTAHEVQPTRTIAELAKADARLKQEFSRITVPILILHGTADNVAKPSGSQRFYDEAGSADKTLKLYEGHFHDLLNDVDKEVVIADIQSWIGERVPVVEERMPSAIA